MLFVSSIHHFDIPTLRKMKGRDLRRKPRVAPKRRDSFGHCWGRGRFMHIVQRICSEVHSYQGPWERQRFLNFGGPLVFFLGGEGSTLLCRGSQHLA